MANASIRHKMFKAKGFQILNLGITEAPKNVIMDPYQDHLL